MSENPPAPDPAPERSESRPRRPRLDTQSVGAPGPEPPQRPGSSPRSPSGSPRVAEEFSTVDFPPSTQRRNTQNTQNTQNTRNTRTTPKSARPNRKRPGRSNAPKWHKDYSQLDPFAGRVLVIDYIKQDKSKASMRRVAVQEITDVHGLQKLYKHPERRDEAVLRLFHVQNAEWATQFLLDKFNVEDKHDLVGKDFGKFVRRKQPERRGKKPFLSGKAWKVQHDPWRSLSKTCFGFDYLRQYRARTVKDNPEDEEVSQKMIELSCFSEDETPMYGYDVFGQRFACYIQHKHDSDDELPPELEEMQFNESHTRLKDFHQTPDYYDNGNAILIFDNSRTGSIEDTLIDARGTWEKRWRRLPFFLAFESRDLVATDEQLGFQCARVIMQDIFHALSDQWGAFLDLAMDHISILEDKVYDQPADETRGPELWLNSSLWLKVERLVYLHIDIIKDLRPRLEELTDDIEAEDVWLADVGTDFDQHGSLVSEDLVKPTENLISLLYQSISIRDSRHNIRLSVSMWRLSWITFVFLPLTFITGFFGMNVDTFSDSPSIKYYFIAVFPFMAFVLIGWYILKHFLKIQSQVLSYKGIYENFYSEMASANPKLWSRHGPRQYIVPKGRLGKLKWQFIRRWTAPEKTIKRDEKALNSVDPANDLGTYNRFKRHLMRRWTSQIAESMADRSSSLEDGEVADDGKADNVGTSQSLPDGSVNNSKVNVIPATPAPDHIYDADPMSRKYDPSSRQDPSSFAFTRYAAPTLLYSANNNLSSQSQHRRSSSTGRSSGVMVEEEDWQWLSRCGKEGKRWALRGPSSTGGAEQQPGQKDDRDGVERPEEGHPQAKDDSEHGAGSNGEENERGRPGPAHD